MESMVVVGIATLVLITAFPNFHGSKRKSALDDGESLVRRSLEMSRSRAITGVGGKDQGVRISAGAITFFEGDFSSGMLTTFALPSGVSTDQSEKDIIFKRLNGETGEDVLIGIFHSSGGERKVVVQADGAITSQ